MESIGVGREAPSEGAGFFRELAITSSLYEKPMTVFY